MFSADLGVTPSSAANYIEDVFSTYLYTGNGSTQTITNGIDLSGKGGLVWTKGRSQVTNNKLVDTARGATKVLISNVTDEQGTDSLGLTSFSTTGYSLSTDSEYNSNGQTYASWSFREQAKFFDVVTYTGTGANRTIAHNLGSVPGCIIVKRTDAVADWQVYHRSATNALYMVLNSTAIAISSATRWNNTTPTATVFSLGTDATVNASGGTYVAYIFAHNAGDFGATGTDNVISCGSYTGNGSATGPTVTLGYEPQWLLIKRITTATGDWNLIDNMRGFVVGGTDAELNPNLINSESTGTFVTPTATGFQINTTDAGYNADLDVFIYIAIRRGPMRTPTSGTSVFGLSARTGTGVNATVTGGQTDDAVLIKNRGSAVASLFSSRLTGARYLVTSSVSPEVAAGTTILQANPWDVMDGVKVGTTSTITNASANTYINYLFRRAPGFFDVVCYTGTGVTRTINHNLTVVPEMWWVKIRSGSNGNWTCGGACLGSVTDDSISLNGASSKFTASNIWTTPTSTTFGIGTGSPTDASINASGSTYVAYLFATVAGVSKVGSYTGTGTALQIDCGFTGGARFVLIKRADDTGDWYYWDSARGIVAGNDPYLLLNSTAAEVTGTDYVDTYSLGFEISSTAPAAINANGGSFIFLAIA